VTPTAMLDVRGNVSVTQVAATSGTPYLSQFVGAAHTTLAAAEAIDVNFALNRTVQFTGSATVGAANITTQRAVVFQAPTYSFSSTGTQTIANAATVAIAGPPVAGTNAAITNPYSLWVQSGVAQFDGGFAATAASSRTYSGADFSIQNTSDASSAGVFAFSSTSPAFFHLMAKGSTFAGTTATLTNASLIDLNLAGSANSLIRTSNSAPLYFATNNVIRLTIAAAGAVTVAGDFAHQGANLGFYATAATTKKTVTGSRAGNAALASLLTQLAAYGLITDSSTV
jgi:hypothetical protein